jgi:hypothetical protein
MTLTSVLLGSSGFYLYRALKLQYFKESIAAIEGKISAAEQIAKATQGSVSLTFAKAGTGITLRAEGLSIKSNALRQLFAETIALREVETVTLEPEAGDLPYTIEIDPNGAWYQQGKAVQKITIRALSGNIDPWTRKCEKQDSTKLYEKYPKQVFDEH